MSFFDFLGWGKDKVRSVGDTESVRRITAELMHLPPETARYLAAFAFLLSRVARADLHITPAEAETMQQILLQTGHLGENEALLVSEMARDQNHLFGATDDFLVTREFRKISTEEQKVDVLRCLFELAAAENFISVAEETEIQRIARELGIPQELWTEVRYSFRDRLAVTQKRPDDSGTPKE